MRLRKTSFGLLVLDQDNKIVTAKPVPASFEDDEEELISYLERETEQERKLKDKYTEQLEENNKSLKRPLGFDQVLDSFQLKEEEAQDKLREAAIVYSEQKIKEDLKDDKEVVNAVKTLDSLDQDLNDILEVCRSWLEFYLSRLSSEQLEKLKIEKEELNGLGAGEIEEVVNKITDNEALQISSGLERLKSLTEALDVVEEEREQIEEWIGSKLEEITPNLSALLEPLLTARLLEAAGSLEKLAKMPSSTVQVLGAEKALFRHMRGEGSSPKHGLIFLHPLVNQTERDKRGKISRFLANKISIASRLDYYGGQFKGDKLRQKVEDKFDQLQEE